MWHKVFFPDLMIKFIYSEKATKFCEIFTLLLSYVVAVKSKVKISQNFVDFSEYMNFIRNLCTFCFSPWLSLWNWVNFSMKYLLLPRTVSFMHALRLSLGLYASIIYLPTYLWYEVHYSLLMYIRWLAWPHFFRT